MDPPVKMIKKVQIISIILALIGVSMAYTALIIDLTYLKELHEDYYTKYDAGNSDEALKTKKDIENTKPLILTMKLAGVATVLLGITIALLGILRMLSLMPIGLGDVLRANMEDMGLGKDKKE